MGHFPVAICDLPSRICNTSLCDLGKFVQTHAWPCGWSDIPHPTLFGPVAQRSCSFPGVMGKVASPLLHLWTAAQSRHTCNCARIALACPLYSALHAACSDHASHLPEFHMGMFALRIMMRGHLQADRHHRAGLHHRESGSHQRMLCAQHMLQNSYSLSSILP